MNTIVVVANGAQARFFTLEPAENPAYESSPRLLEQECLVNLQQEASGKELWSDNSGGNRSTGGGGSHGYDDHRGQHRAEYERRYAQQVAAATTQLARERKANSVVLAADSRLLGLMREELHRANGFDLKPVSRDYSKLSALELHEQLAGLDLLPARRKPGGQ
ncbi:MAG TPA: host attachment protein [Methylophilaceae bacterium]|nr:host attachment protein [Methylophilaceae bacterium]